MKECIIHPDSKSELIEINEDLCIFSDGSKLPVYNGIPILFGKNSLFSYTDITNSKSTTQNINHLDTTNFKNYIRRKILPSLTCDFNMDERYANMALILPEGSTMLILGAGEKINYYKKIFSKFEVYTSDVHSFFKPDYIFDGHNIPFKSNTFDLILAAQVIEHVLNPWQFCNELQRVTKLNGYLLIEAPQNFPYHAEPYDFFRFTFTGFRSLFTHCEVIDVQITEGNASMLAVSISNYLINISSKRIVRSMWLLISYLMLGWLKYLDKLQSSVNRRTVTMPKGYSFIFKKDNKERKANDFFIEFYNLKK